MFRIEMSNTLVDELSCDLLMVPFYQGQRPPRGDAGWIDWRLYGRLSQWLLDGKVVDDSFESILLTSEGKLQSPWILLVGLGEDKKIPPLQGKSWIARILKIGMRLRVESLAISLSFAQQIHLPVQEIGEGIVEALQESQSLPLSLKNRRLVLVGHPTLLKAVSSSLDLLRSAYPMDAEVAQSQGLS
ncbi:MAG: hypothetical protein HY538_01225 [Deltaproteobacteria bacterium]|nr:hypothetical protein [Deltaproteobacteria bacterium]